MPSFSSILLTVSEKKNFEYFFKNLLLMSPRQPIKSSNLDKSCIKHGGLLNKHFCKKKSNIPKDLAEIVNFHFSHYKTMETLSCHSNQSSYLREIKNITFVKGYGLSKYTKGPLYPPYGFWDYSINISVKKIQISPLRQKKIAIFHFSHYKSMGTISCHSNQSSYPTGIKNITFCSPYLEMLCV